MPKASVPSDVARVVQDESSEGAFLSVIIPTRNAARTLERCVTAARASPAVGEVIVVDNASSDATASIAQRAGARLLRTGPERSAQRNAGLREARGQAVAFLDADQIAEPEVLAEALVCVRNGADAVILTEASIGIGFWSEVRAFERAWYRGDDLIEACRVFRTDFVRDLGGFDEGLDAFEDWDLTARARTAGARVARTRALVLHEEGRLTLQRAMSKKRAYAAFEAAYRAKHPTLAALQLSPITRMSRLLRHVPGLARHPVLALGMFTLKTLEFLASRRSRA